MSFDIVDHKLIKTSLKPYPNLIKSRMFSEGLRTVLETLLKPCYNRIKTLLKPYYNFIKTLLKVY
jgi:hypothetical protein